MTSFDIQQGSGYIQQYYGSYNWGRSIFETALLLN